MTSILPIDAQIFKRMPPKFVRSPGFSDFAKSEDVERVSSQRETSLLDVHILFGLGHNYCEEIEYYSITFIRSFHCIVAA